MPGEEEVVSNEVTPWQPVGSSHSANLTPPQPAASLLFLPLGPLCVCPPTHPPSLLFRALRGAEGRKKNTSRLVLLCSRRKRGKTGETKTLNDQGEDGERVLMRMS